LIYRPPSSRPETIGQLSELFRDAEKNSVFFGDFNLPDINWSTGVAGSSMSRGVVEAVAEAGLQQLVDFPTHTRGNTLDLIITNIPERITNIREEARIGKSDHVTIMSELKMTSSSRTRIRVKNWCKANWDGIKQGIKNTIWPTAADNTTVEEAWDLLRTRLDELTATNVPECEFKDRGADWMTTEFCS
jgi:hypothetical protein